MPKKGNVARFTKRSIPGGNDEPPNRFAPLLKWIGGITAILSLVFALQQITQTVSDVRERQRNTAELYRVAKVQQAAADYPAAWASLDQGLKAAEPGGQLAKLMGQLGEERKQLREAQEDLAMEWLENIRVIASRDETFSDVVDKLVPALSRGVASSSGARKGDLLAHFGWANFLRWRDGNRQVNPEQQYRQALEIDPRNPYAHAYWGHWELWTRREASLQDAREHFSVALASGRARDLVRRTQLSAVGNLGREGEEELLRVVNEMQKHNERIDDSTRNDVYSIYYSALSAEEDFRRLTAAVPATEQIAMIRALFYNADFDPSKIPSREASLAILQEAAGRRDEALKTWRALRSGLSPNTRGTVVSLTDAAIRRLSKKP